MIEMQQALILGQSKQILFKYYLKSIMNLKDNEMPLFDLGDMSEN
jgi:hypothetical protein